MLDVSKVSYKQQLWLWSHRARKFSRLYFSLCFKVHLPPTLVYLIIILSKALLSDMLALTVCFSLWSDSHCFLISPSFNSLTLSSVTFVHIRVITTYVDSCSSLLNLILSVTLLQSILHNAVRYFFIDLIVSLPWSKPLLVPHCLKNNAQSVLEEIKTLIIIPTIFSKEHYTLKHMEYGQCCS